MRKILVSSCLAGENVRYNGGCLSIADENRDWLDSHFEIVRYCPEVASGLPTPRAPAEIVQGTGKDVLDQGSLVIGNDGIDVTDYFLNGAKLTLQFCQKHGIEYAILAESSPSCGSSTIYDGTFTGTKIPGRGVTTELLERNGIQVFSQHSIALLKTRIEQSEQEGNAR
ncbi:DUF523 domain-containing protein [Pseudomonas stutzeri]|uniref:DUF523 domain-containing protein n=1 Tax=Stutzerimonas stutzeri TaxID=316 RepID=A0A2N8S6B5_STUST|nr:DUF523 domain-containing protein [Stutzerimonas stutzeri]MCQ4297668.1 DUF523 domain-containing protein [Stutzerimonas stutzeri]PNF82168.1 DUF523 domain-containing protein [Stutzerimonas stutzeri]